MLDQNEKTITRAVIETLARTPDDRLRLVLTGLVHHLHDFIREVSLTEAEWEAAVDFLTRTGQLCSAERQEFILLSDVLGATMLVDAVNHQRSSQATENSVLGPWFRTQRPALPDGADISSGLPGIPLHFHATVVDSAGAPVAGAGFDVWHADADGHYDSDVPGLTGPAMRGLFHTSGDGTVNVRTIAPAPYPIPGDGPVGDLMHATQRSLMRPGHVHVRIEAPGFSPVTTMLFRDDDPYLANDPVFGTKRSLLYLRDERNGPDGPYEVVSWTFVLDRRSPETGA
jgi:hydroxyquinol 1,2-dioxygenase